ncbi:MAG: hypothetical protein WD425_21330 [Nitrospirales bacterium]
MKPNPKKLKVLNRTKTIAATVAALGAAIGVNMADVLAGSADVQPAESGKAAISSQKIKKPDVSTPKVERAIQQRPSAFIDKSSQPGLKTRPNVKANKAAPMLPNRPDSRSNKLGK